MMQGERNQALSILLLEDEPLILMDLEFAVEDAGCNPHAATTVKRALSLLDEAGSIDVAVLDVTLQHGTTCIPVAEELARRNIPFLLHSGDLNRQNETVRNLRAKHIPKPADATMVIREAMELALCPSVAENQSMRPA